MRLKDRLKNKQNRRPSQFPGFFLLAFILFFKEKLLFFLHIMLQDGALYTLSQYVSRIPGLLLEGS